MLCGLIGINWEHSFRISWCRSSIDTLYIAYFGETLFFASRSRWLHWLFACDLFIRIQPSYEWQQDRHCSFHESVELNKLAEKLITHITVNIRWQRSFCPTKRFLFWQDYYWLIKRQVLCMIVYKFMWQEVQLSSRDPAIDALRQLKFYRLLYE